MEEDKGAKRGKRGQRSVRKSTGQKPVMDRRFTRSYTKGLADGTIKPLTTPPSKPEPEPEPTPTPHSAPLPPIINNIDGKGPEPSMEDISPPIVIEVVWEDIQSPSTARHPFLKSILKKNPKVRPSIPFDSGHGPRTLAGKKKKPSFTMSKGNRRSGLYHWDANQPMKMIPNFIAEKSKARENRVTAPWNPNNALVNSRPNLKGTLNAQIPPTKISRPESKTFFPGLRNQHETFRNGRIQHPVFRMNLKFAVTAAQNFDLEKNLANGGIHPNINCKPRRKRVQLHGPEKNSLLPPLPPPTGSSLPGTSGVNCVQLEPQTLGSNSVQNETEVVRQLSEKIRMLTPAGRTALLAFMDTNTEQP